MSKNISKNAPAEAIGDNSSKISLGLVFEDKTIETSPISADRILRLDSIGMWSDDLRESPKADFYVAPFPTRGNPMLTEDVYVTMSGINEEIDQILLEYTGE